MGKVKQFFVEFLSDEVPVPSHLEKEMYEEIVKLKKQVTAIKLILEECK